VVVTFTSTIFILFFFLKEKNLFVGVLHALVPTKYEAKVVHSVDSSKTMLSRYFRGLLAQMGGFFALVTLILWILGVKNALLIGSFGGLVNAIPYVGPILGFVFGAFITLSSSLEGDFYTQVLPLLIKVGIAFGVAQTIDNLFLQPMIFSNSVAAHPLEIFIVILVGAKLGGVLGMVLAIPAYTVFRVVAKTFFNEFKFVQKITGRMDDDEAI
jgi:predicted PurR-regulated permease PerM